MGTIRSTAAMPAGLVGDTAALDVATRPATLHVTPSLTAPSPEARPADGAPAALPFLTPERRRYTYVRETFGPGAILGSIPSAAIAQVFNTPNEWGRGSSGYARRYASAFGAQIVRNTLLFGAGAAFHEDRRYVRLGAGGVARRAAGFAAGELVGFATGNLVSEFGPDVLHALGRIVHRGPRE